MHGKPTQALVTMLSTAKVQSHIIRTMASRYIDMISYLALEDCWGWHNVVLDRFDLDAFLITFAVVI